MGSHVSKDTEADLIRLDQEHTTMLRQLLAVMKPNLTQATPAMRQHLYQAYRSCKASVEATLGQANSWSLSLIHI